MKTWASIAALFGLIAGCFAAVAGQWMLALTDFGMCGWAVMYVVQTLRLEEMKW